MTTTTDGPVPRCPVLHGQGFDPSLPAQAGDPYPWLRQAQREVPIFYLDLYGMWVVTRHADGLEVIRDTATYSSRKVLDFSQVSPDFYEAFPDRPDRVLVTIDPPEHTPLRKVSQRGFTPRMVAAWEPEVHALVDGLIDAFIAKGRCDFVTEFADWLPVQAITRVVGAPFERHGEFAEWAADRIIMLEGAPGLDAEERRVVIERAVRFDRWLRQFVDERRAAPRDDLVSALVEARGKDGEPVLSTSEVVSLVGTILAAGTSTTANFIPVALRELLRHPDVWRRLQEDRSLIPQAIEECLRLRTSLRGTVRTTTRPVTLGGISLPEGADIYIHLGAAQQDPEVFPDPTRFDIDRPNLRDHFAFGRWTHICLGAPLVRLEVRVMLERILDRMPDVALASDQEEEWLPNFAVPRLQSLELVWAT